MMRCSRQSPKARGANLDTGATSVTQIIALDREQQLAGAIAEIEKASAVLRRSEPALKTRYSEHIGSQRGTQLLVIVDPHRLYLDFGDAGRRQRDGRNPLPAGLTALQLQLINAAR